MGGENIHVAHYLKDCISWGNKRSGVDSNYNPGFKMRNIISYNNEGPNIKLYSGTGNIMKDENGSQTDANKKPYKFDYDMKGVVSSTRLVVFGLTRANLILHTVTSARLLS